MFTRPKRIGVIGYGAVGEEIVRGLENRGELHVLAAVLDAPARLPDLVRKAAGRFPVFATLDELLALNPDLVIEAAGHEAVKSFGSEILRRGFDLLIASVGALTDKACAARLLDSAACGAELWIASGAVAGLDGLLAARSAGLRSVTYTSVKEPKAWLGTPAEELIKQSAHSERLIFFEGTAREAAAQYPQNANVAAAIALAGIGLDRTRVRLGADANVAGPLGLIEADGDFGRFSFEILALASPYNPKSSAITGHSLVAAARDGMCFRALELLREL
jgi:aspartate dehydrogenase